ncbi:MAG TPA: hypothetical protein VGQ89_04705 [Candidatus Limnocylindrales bacterium]|nr:hypothetical protein [Candidatus Limnocylindrales bacterium]
MTRNPILEDVLGPLGAAIVREIAARGEAGVGEIREYLRRIQRRQYATSPTRADLAYYSYYAAGFRVTQIVNNELVEVGHFIDAGGNWTTPM